ncbi:MAG: HDOD domain-containing protein, partial [Planctomycetales bacterium]|nr:HDOD domain-containing protein [Planctomycetales bacterium]
MYTLPAVALEVLRLTESPDVDAAAIKACIERDPALVTKLLRTVNSSVFGLGRTVTDLNQAVALLGVKPLKLLVLGFSLPPKLLTGLEHAALARYWRHTLIKAVAARELAATTPDVDDDDAFLAGLLQDIGALVLLKDLGEPYASFLERARAEGVNLRTLELETLGFDHQVLSARMLKQWGLPETLATAIAVSPSSVQRMQLPKHLRNVPPILHTADLLAALLVDGSIEALDELLANDPSRDVKVWEDFARLLKGKVDQLADAFAMALPDNERYDDVVARAHKQLALAAEEATPQLLKPAGSRTWEEIRELTAAAEQSLAEPDRAADALSKPDAKRGPAPWRNRPRKRSPSATVD